ncbi:MAG: Asp-tRNA(Asn)/Glu-tRNA(Gln) amidotransferase subunit GatA [Anaerolineae bacterium]|nr:MAG: Asp-tRNA(Asn)/Glu-tRNA(Gln) amidotransferase subunit GatA [Anaerolineae bacterium]
MNEVLLLTAAQMQAGLRRGEYSSQELTRACLEQIERLEDRLHAFITLAPEMALEQARRADELLTAWRRQGGELPPLLGIPLAVKDVLAVRGLPCTAGSRILEGFVPPYNATAVERVLQAGAVVLGKTNTDEFAMGSSTENSAFGVTHNPWNLERVPGGSSGGSAAAVAGRMAPFALGTDTGGSVRQPAAFCGLTGLKPTYGRISRYGLFAYASSLDTVGVLAHTAEDAALLYGVMQGEDVRDATSLRAPVEAVDLSAPPDFERLRLGVVKEYRQHDIQPEIAAALEKVVRQFQEMGATVQEVSLPSTRHAVPVYYLIAPAEASANLARYDGIRYGPRQPADTLPDLYRRTRGRLFGREVKRRIMLGTFALSAGYQEAYYGKAQRVRQMMQQDFARAFEQVDVLLAPVAPTTAFPIGAHRGDPLSMYLEDIFTLPANLTGVPAISFPAGFDQSGLPVGLQLLGGPRQEALLLQLVHAFQQVTAWHNRTPPLVLEE